MQSIAEEVVSSSGGGGTYITSGFSNYVGHSAIGFGQNTPSGYAYDCVGIGIITSYSTIKGYICIQGTSTFTIDAGTAYQLQCAIVF